MSPHASSLFAAVATLSFAALPGCGVSSAEAPDSASSADEALTGASLAGYWSFVGDSATNRWVEAIAFRADGTFDANMGNNVSNLSGHHFPAGGQWTFTPTANGGVLALSYTAFGTWDDRYDVELHGKTLRMKLENDPEADWFGMENRKAATVTFDASWHVTQDRPLVAGMPLVVRYAAARSTCALPSGGAYQIVPGASVDGQAHWDVLDVPFPSHPTKGFIGALGRVPDGHTLSLWFRDDAVRPDGSAACTTWDSRFGQNYTFPITKP